MLIMSDFNKCSRMFICEMDNEMDKQMDSISGIFPRCTVSCLRRPEKSGRVIITCSPYPIIIPSKYPSR